MKCRNLLCSLAVVFALVLPGHAQTIRSVVAVQTASATLTATNANCVAAACIGIELGGYKTVEVQVTGTCGTCTLQFETNIDNVSANWVSANMLPISGTQTAVTSTSTTGIWTGTVPAARFRARLSALTSGSFVVTIRATF